MTQTEQKPVSTSVDALADQMLVRHNQQQQKDQENKESKRTRLDQQAIVVLQTLLAMEIEAGLLAQLHLTYEVSHDGHNSPRTEAVCHYADIVWRISRDFNNRSSENGHWYINAIRNSYGYQEPSLSTRAEPRTLQSMLLLKFGERREQLRKKSEEDTRKDEQKRQAEAREQADEERRQRERTERIAQADQEDSKWRTQLASLKRQAQEAMWTWPKDVKITIFQLTYITAATRDESGESIIEQENGWTSTDQLDWNGYILIEPSKSYSWSRNASEPREIKLDMTTHRPVWERFTLSSVQGLPDSLCNEISVSIPNVFLHYDPALLGATSRLRKEEGCDLYSEDSPYTETVGRVPLPWVQELVGQAAFIRRQEHHETEA